MVIYIKEPRLMKKLPSRSIRASEDALAELRAAFGSDCVVVREKRVEKRPPMH